MKIWQLLNLEWIINKLVINFYKDNIELAQNRAYCETSELEIKEFF